jgi:hypothetical protein
MAMRWLVLLTFLVGLAVGVSGALLAPRLAGPYLPEALRGPTPVIEGEVAQKQRQGDRLLLTVVTPHGSMLVTFRKKVAEIDLLLEQGDTLTLILRQYAPFVEDPMIERVRKAKPTADREEVRLRA